MYWQICLIVLSMINILTLFTYIFFKIILRPRKAHRSLPVISISCCQLQGMLLGSFLGIIFALQDSDLSCVIIRFSTGMCYTLMFAPILVQQVFAVFLNNGVCLPPVYQGLLLFFSVLVQIVLSIQWSFLTPNCQFISQDFVLSLFYNLFLIFSILFISIWSLSLPKRPEDATILCLMTIIIFFSWLVWMFSVCLLPRNYHKAIIGDRLNQFLILLIYLQDSVCKSTFKWLEF